MEQKNKFFFQDLVDAEHFKKMLKEKYDIETMVMSVNAIDANVGFYYEDADDWDDSITTRFYKVVDTSGWGTRGRAFREAMSFAALVLNTHSGKKPPSQLKKRCSCGNWVEFWETGTRDNYTGESHCCECRVSSDYYSQFPEERD